jgi:hypothetical protein
MKRQETGVPYRQQGSITPPFPLYEYHLQNKEPDQTCFIKDEAALSFYCKIVLSYCCDHEKE